MYSSISYIFKNKESEYSIYPTDYPNINISTLCIVDTNSSKSRSEMHTTQNKVSNYLSI